MFPSSRNMDRANERTIRKMKKSNGSVTGRALLIVTSVFLFLLGTAMPAATQEQQQGAVVDRSGGTPVYRVTVVARTTPAINYQHRSGPTQVDFRGTDLMPQARGQVVVNSKEGRIEIKTRMEHLTPATQFGPEFLTYVLWAVTPEGRPKNLGEVLLNSDNSKIEVTTDLQTFGLIVTAEPYFAVTQPSDVVVMENVITDRTRGTIEPIDTHYELLQRGQYVLNVNKADLQAFVIDRKTPLELYEARNAVRIARWIGAQQYASDTLQKAEVSLQNAEDEYAGRRTNKKTVAQNSRDAAQEAEDARLITVRRIEDQQQADAQAAAAEQQAEAAAQAAQAGSERAAAERARLEAERGKEEADAAAQRALQEKNDAEAQRAAEAERARLAVAQAEEDKAKLREQLREQLNAVLETRETARGLIVNMSDVLFDTGRYTLKPGAKEKLAKISGILLGHPGLQLEVDGHTDSVGSDEFNLRLSEERADAVRSYLVAQGVPSESVSAHGFGKEQPVASNDTAAGRQLNRRVELVVSGPAIAANRNQNPGR
jgi:outer membrane protein OmpA-like peptidoglycan-associated protein